MSNEYNSELVKKVFEICMEMAEDEEQSKSLPDDYYYSQLESLEPSWDGVIEEGKEQRFADYLKSMFELNEKKIESQKLIQLMQEIDSKTKVDNWQVSNEDAEQSNSINNIDKEICFREFGDC